MNGFPAMHGHAYVARYGWSKRIKGSVALALGAVLVAVFIVADRFSSWNDLAELAVLGLFAVCLARTAGPPLRRDVAVAIDAPGIVLGGLGFWSARRELIPWPQITGVRLYEYTWSDTGSERASAIYHYPAVHVDRRGWRMTRLSVTPARLTRSSCGLFRSPPTSLSLSKAWWMPIHWPGTTGCWACWRRYSISRTGCEPAEAARQCPDPGNGRSSTHRKQGNGSTVVTRADQRRVPERGGHGHEHPLEYTDVVLVLLHRTGTTAVPRCGAASGGQRGDPADVPSPS